jgi:hypothetical protein
LNESGADAAVEESVAGELVEGVLDRVVCAELVGGVGELTDLLLA